MNDRLDRAKDLRSLAHGAVRQEDLETAKNLFARVVGLDPSGAEDWYELALAAWKTDDTDVAQKALKRAVSLQPKNAQWLFMYANLIGSLGNHAQAIASLRRSITLGLADPAAAWVEIAKLHERMRRIPLARKAIDEALKARPGYGSAYEVLGKLAESEGDLEEALRCYGMAVTGMSNVLEKAAVAHAIGAVREKQKAWDEAFAAHDQANRFKAASPLARSLGRHSLQEYQKSFGAEGAEEYYQGWKSRPPLEDGLPDPIFLVGFPRSGTTMTEQILASLPNIRTTDEHPFMSPVNQRALAMIGQLSDPPEGHLARLDLLTPGQISELRTLYWNGVWRFVAPEVREKGLRVVDKHPLRILDLGMANLLFPRSRAITLIRDPRDCCLSCFFQELGLTPVSVRFLRLETLGEIYATIMGMWLGMRDRLTIETLQIRYEDLVTDFEPNARKLVAFVGEEWTDDVLEFHKKAARRTINTPSYQAVTQKVNTRAVGKWANYEKHLGPLLAQVRPFLEAFGYEE